MTDSARVSVCMATYNGERYIEDQLNSILVQLSPTDEVIIVDDASRDRTLEIINEMGDDRVRLIRHDVNRGVLASFERAIRSATGQIIFLSDQDDLWESNKVSEFLKAFLDHPEAAVVISDATLINERDEVIAISKFATRPFRPGLIANLFHSRFIGCLMAFRSTLLPRILPFPGGLDVLHDIWIGTNNSVSGGGTWYIEKPLTLYRRHGGNVTGVTRLPRRRQVRLRMHLLLALALSCLRGLRTTVKLNLSSRDSQHL